MKKIAYIFGVAAIAVGCQQTQVETIEPVAGEAYQIEALIPGTKTTFTPPYAVAWDSSDKLSVVVQSSGSYGTPYTFTKSTTAGDYIFECTGFKPADEGSAYHIIYNPTGDAVSLDSDGVSSTPITVGCAKDGSQTQKGIGTAGTALDHIKAPLTGYTATTSACPQITMNHVTTLLDVQVTNNLGEAVTISEVTVETTDLPLVGSFNVKPYGAAITAVEDATSNIAQLTVSDGIIAAAGVGNFYLIAAPFTLSANGSMTVTVKTNDGKTYEVTKAAGDSNRNFIKGTVNTLTVSLNRESTKITVSTENVFATYWETSTPRLPSYIVDDDLSTSFHTPWTTATFKYYGEDTEYTNNWNCMQQVPLFIDFKFTNTESVDYLILTSNSNNKLGICNLYYTTNASDYGNTAKDLSGTSWQIILPADGNTYKNTNYDSSTNYTNKTASGAWNLKEEGGVQTIMLPSTLENVAAIRLHCINGYGGQVQIDEMEFYKYTTTTDTAGSTDSSEGTTATTSSL